MADSITISQLPPPFKSMQYELLREAGLNHIQQLSGKIWTDDNAHDPGITILEALAYAITDLGYRTNYNIKDILTTNPEIPEDIRNFFQAKEIMPNYPVTYKDYRKLMIDVEIPTLDPNFCESVGVKNAWIEISKENEILFYLDSVNKTLSYTQPAPSVLPTRPKVLYDVLLEFTSCEPLGDLNENTLNGTFGLYLTGATSLNPVMNTYKAPNAAFTADIPGPLNGVKVKFEVEFPRWDTPGVDWSDETSIRNNMRGITLELVHLPEGYKLENYGIDNAGNSWMTMTFQNINVVNTAAMEYEIDQFIYESTTGLIYTYQKKVQKINDILAAVEARLMENRNLGEDFFRYNAIKIDEIALCADIDVLNNAVIEKVQADIFYAVRHFLDPTVFFYSLSEMYEKGLTTDQIFEGPLLQHGFIDDADLVKAERRKTIHVSDLINIIMDIPGVVAIKNIQIAGIPLDNDDNLPTDAVKWCLEIPLEKNYVPRLTVDRSKLLFFKDQLPYKANSVKSQEILDELEATDRPQKITNPDYDIHLSPGEYKDIQNYYSIQEEFPVVYGVGSPGLPATASVERRAQAKQLKGYLLFFDQLLANYLSQLFHVKDLFSMNEEKGPDGNPVINSTYFSQSLVNIVPDALPLYFDPVNNPEDLQAITEDIETYNERRNRFLDHLMARFSESFADYAMVVYKIDGPKAPEELIEDKLEFLNNYPLISSARFNAFNYKQTCELWHINNISGLERRVSYLCGVDKPLPASLAFGVNFVIEVADDPDQYYLIILDDSSGEEYVYSPGGPDEGFPSLDEAKQGMETLITAALFIENFVMYNGTGIITDPTNPGTGSFRFEIYCEGKLVGIGIKKYNVFANMQDDIGYIIELAEAEFYENPESNRYNLECFMDKYVSTTGPNSIAPNPPCPEGYFYDFNLSEPESGNTLLTGVIKGLVYPPYNDYSDAGEANKERLLMDMLRDASDFANYRFGFDPTDPTMEVFTVVDECGDVIATSFEEDFNQHIQDVMVAIMGNPPNDEIYIESSTGNDGSYILSSVTVDMNNARRLKVTIDPSSPVFPIPSPTADGFFRIKITSAHSALQPTVLDANIADNYFEVDKVLHRIVFPGNTIHVNSGPDEGEYTVVKVVPSGMNSLIYVKETIVSTDPESPTIDYVLMLPITAVDNINPNNDFYITPGADEVAARELADWIKAKFFSHEGMHVIEHVLLRPKYNQLGDMIKIATGNNNALVSGLPVSGFLNFIKQFPLTGIVQGTKTFIFTGAFAGDVSPLQQMRIVNSPANDNIYTIRSAANVGPNTEIRVYESIPDGTVAGNLQYSKTIEILGIAPPTNAKVFDPFFVSPFNNDVIITGSTDGINDGKFKLLSASQNGLWRFSTRMAIIKDNFLPVDIDNECGFCRFEDPYSHIVSIVLPAWQGRFVNPDFRKFFDRTLRLECPAHIVLNICWIDCKQMGELELKYKKWLVENARTVPNKYEVSKGLNAVIDILTRLRSIYPEGTLHDCEVDSGEANAIILNNTVLGTL
jgi:hypothetical protein